MFYLPRLYFYRCVNAWIWQYFLLLEPLYVFPMDKIVDGQLSGSVPGGVIGDVKLVSGKRGQALYTNGIDQRVNLGNQRHNCMGNLSKCDNGFVMAMWLQVHKCGGRRYYDDEYYISNGGHTVNAIGVALLMREGRIMVNFRTDTLLWEFYYEEALALHTWYHLVLTWDSVSGGSIYINGVRGSQKQVGRAMNSNVYGNRYVDFMLGDRVPPGGPGEMTLDELRIWDAVMNETDAWNVYSVDVFP